MFRYLIAVLMIFFLSENLSGKGSADENNPDLLYNQALSYYKENDFIKSDEKIDELLSKKENIPPATMMLAANNSFKLSSSISGNPEEITNALNEVEKSISWYKRILELNSENVAAAHNLELAFTLREQLLQNKESQENQQSRSEAMKDELENLQEQQKELASDQGKGSEEHQSQQEELNKQTGELKQNMPGSNQEFRENMEKAEEKQNQAMEAIENGNYEKAAESQDEAAEALSQAIQAISEENSQNRESGQTEQEKAAPSENDQVAQSIIENENNRETSSESTSGGIIVDRNW